MENTFFSPSSFARITSDTNHGESALLVCWFDG